MIDDLFSIAFASAQTAIFEVGSIMAVLMLIFGVLDYKFGDRLREIIEKKTLDKPIIMTGLTLIPVDGTLLFQYSLYRRGSIRLGSLLAGIIGFGEEATFLILAFNPLAWLMLAVIKLVLAVTAGGILNHSKRVVAWGKRLHEKDLNDSVDVKAVEADENFHELPDKFRHKLHHFRYHSLGVAFWIFFASAFILQMTLNLLSVLNIIDPLAQQALGIPYVSWLAMIALFVVFIYRLIVRITTKEFGKIFEHEFEDVIDAIGDLAETCASIILLIFLMTFLIDALVNLAGEANIARIIAGRGFLTVIIGALIALIPGTGASLAFTSLYFSLAGTSSAMPFAALAACSIALIGDSQFIGKRLLRNSQRAAHLIAFGLALLAGGAIYAVEIWLLPLIF